MTVYYSPEAEADLDDVAWYTAERWSPAQAAKYLDLLLHACEHILPDNLTHARPVLRRPGLQRWRCERHVIIFRARGQDILIARILHQRMLPENHL